MLLLCIGCMPVMSALAACTLPASTDSGVFADITIGPLVVDAIRPLTDAPLDTHL